MPRHVYQVTPGAQRVLRMQSGENDEPRLTADELRKRLYALMDDPATAEQGLPGAVLTQYQRCRYARCRCRRGQPHGPYYFWAGRMFGVTWKKYLKRAEAPRVMALCRRYRDRRWTRAKARALLRDFKQAMCQLDVDLLERCLHDWDTIE